MLSADRTSTKGPTRQCHHGSRLVDDVFWCSDRLVVSIPTGVPGQTGIGPGGAYTISAFTEVIRAMITSIRANAYCLS